ncbi:MAG: hypothetical protein U9R19_06165, partial [Bacteroidota bacterium]|nr:hypothetical protein [Bacteroidota bacterium]
MKKIKYLIISTIIFPFVAFSQSYTIDTTWCPDSIFLHPYQTEFPLVSGIAEHEDGRVFIAGQFGRNGHPSLSSIVFFNIDGSVNPDFDRFLYSNYVNYTTYCEVSGDTLIFARWGVVANKFDIFGNWLMYDYDLNFHEDIDCSVFYNIYLYPDGSLLATGHDIRLYSDPTRYELIKLKPDGHLDSSVVISPEETPNTYIEEVFRYDENRFLAYGRFDSWYGYPINDFCRFYIETGEIDTTFHNIFSEGGPASVRVLPDGKILLVGIFRFPGDTTYYGITRLN